jgi:hypothetical protein
MWQACGEEKHFELKPIIMHNNAQSYICSDCTPHVSVDMPPSSGVQSVAVPAAPRSVNFFLYA